VIEFPGVNTKVGAAVSLLFAVVATTLSNMYGGWNASLSVLLWLVIGDYVTGLIASAIDGSGLSSKVGYKGIAKKVMIFFLVLLAHKLDVAIGVRVMMSTVIYFYVTNELISLIENMGRMGMPVPQQLVNIIYVLKGKTK